MCACDSKQKDTGEWVRLSPLSFWQMPSYYNNNNNTYNYNSTCFVAPRCPSGIGAPQGQEIMLRARRAPTYIGDFPDRPLIIHLLA